MGWVEADGAGWSWVHSLVIPFEILMQCNNANVVTVKIQI